MAGPQFLTPRPASSARPVKRFTLAEANRTLPLVQRIVQDIVKRHEELSTLQTALSAGKPANAAEAETAIARLAEQLQNYFDELRDIGCDLKDVQIGLVDFIGRHRGHDVCLCWKLGEEQVAYWHELQTGFAGRQPVSILEEN